MKSAGYFPQPRMALLFALPQLMALALFFYWPALQAIWWSFHLVLPFGGSELFVGLNNYWRVLRDPGVLASLGTTLIFSVSSVVLSMLVALGLALCLELKLRGKALFRNLLIWPYAVSGATIGIVFHVLANPVVGILAWLNQLMPGTWAPYADPLQGMLLLIVAYAWCLVPFNFVMLVASLKSVPDEYLAAAALDGAGPWRRMLDMQLPLIAPYVMFICIIDLLESLSNSFGLIDTLTQGGPGDATQVLAYKIYSDGFRGLDLAGSSTLSVLMMSAVVLLSIAQFRLMSRLKGRGAKT
ncbi:glycerol-3-phosphate transporter permease [Pseudomonas floridensis]|uniref:sn-glycerol-3-phosphate transport system permease protein UgpA n=1 Tax=Pseudomonas floridensis TaxID=1958950 RepID=A0A1X0N7Y2_9PSED|nr:sugar ABC transporter permease [Pseudomonas floridensis]ORC59936.1 glycerol-3-phosphate transporter permease [Pseudomonas floridensis]